MVKLGDILGINARSAEYLYRNTKMARKRADDKLLTKKVLKAKKIPHPELLGVLSNHRKVNDFDWEKLTGGFVIKPVKGFGGQGILLARKSVKEQGKFLLADGRRVTADDLKLHALDIVEGRYSHNNLPDKAMIEERIKIHPKFKKMAVGGAPDIRVIVFNKVPVMAMLRLPTEESMGKANLHQGALGLGIDMATGITTYGVYKNEPIKYFPDSNRKINGITIPHWDKILKMAIQTQLASRLSYLSVDMLIDADKGPVVLELNDQPGLSIQLANMQGLKKRLERVEGIAITDADKGVKISKTLFASEFANRVKFETQEKRVVKVFDRVRIKPHKGKRIWIDVKIDTGAYSTSIDRKLAEKLGLLADEHVLLERKFKSALGEEIRKLIEVDFFLKGRRIKSCASITSRSHLQYNMIIGRRDLKGFVIDPLIDEEMMSARN